MAEQIKDFEGYLRRMQNGMDDKLWWVNKVDSKIIIDYGCADGALLSMVSEMNPNLNLYGYDFNDNMSARVVGRYSYVGSAYVNNLMEVTAGLQYRF